MFHSQQNKPPWFTFTLQALLSLFWQWWARCSLTRSVIAQAWRGTRCWSRSTTRSHWWRWRPKTATRSCHMTSRSPPPYTTLCLIRSVNKPPQKTAASLCHMTSWSVGYIQLRFNQFSKKTTTENRDKIMSHEKPVTTAIYNSTTKLPLWLWVQR